MADPGVQLRRRIALYSFAFLALGVSMALPGAALPFDELPLPEDVRSDGSGVGWWRDLRRSKLRLFLRCDPV